MRAVVYDQHGLRVDQQFDRPEPGPGQALLHVKQSGVCNTDLELVAGMYGFKGILGHEFVADVIDGPQEWVGQRVVGEINVACGDCDMCRLGVPSQCRNRTTVGIDRHPGAFADYLALTTANLYRVPDSVSDDSAVFVEPLAAALQVVESVHIAPRDHVVVVGAGKLGLLVAQVLRLTGTDLSVIVRRERPAQLLAKWGIRAVAVDELAPKQAQVVVDCTGNAEGFATALNLVEPRGTLVLKSTYNGLPQADLTRVVVDEVRVVGSRCGPFGAALRLLDAGVVDVDALIDARYDLSEALSAFDQARQPGTLKVMLHHQANGSVI